MYAHLHLIAVATFGRGDNGTLLPFLHLLGFLGLKREGPLVVPPRFDLEFTQALR